MDLVTEKIFSLLVSTQPTKLLPINELKCKILLLSSEPLGSKNALKLEKHLHLI